MVDPIDTTDFQNGPGIKLDTRPPTKKEVFLAKLADLKLYAQTEMVTGRPKSMVITKLDEARMWASEVEEIIHDLPPQ